MMPLLFLTLSVRVGELKGDWPVCPLSSGVPTECGLVLCAQMWRWLSTKRCRRHDDASPLQLDIFLRRRTCRGSPAAPPSAAPSQFFAMVVYAQRRRVSMQGLSMSTRAVPFAAAWGGVRLCLRVP